MCRIVRRLVRRRFYYPRHPSSLQTFRPRRCPLLQLPLRRPGHKPWTRRPEARLLRRQVFSSWVFLLWTGSRVRPRHTGRPGQRARNPQEDKRKKGLAARARFPLFPKVRGRGSICLRANRELSWRSPGEGNGRDTRTRGRPRAGRGQGGRTGLRSGRSRLGPARRYPVNTT